MRKMAVSEVGSSTAEGTLDTAILRRVQAATSTEKGKRGQFSPRAGDSHLLWSLSKVSADPSCPRSG